MKCGPEDAPSTGYSSFCIHGDHWLCEASGTRCACPKHRRTTRQLVDLAARERRRQFKADLRRRLREQAR